MFQVHAVNWRFQRCPALFSFGDQGEQAGLIYGMSFCSTEKEQERWWKHSMVLKAADGMWHISCLLTSFGQNENQANSKVNKGGYV